MQWRTEQRTSSSCMNIRKNKKTTKIFSEVRQKCNLMDEAARTALNPETWLRVKTPGKIPVHNQSLKIKTKHTSPHQGSPPPLHSGTRCRCVSDRQFHTSRADSCTVPMYRLESSPRITFSSGFFFRHEEEDEDERGLADAPWKHFLLLWFTAIHPPHTHSCVM